MPSLTVFVGDHVDRQNVKLFEQVYEGTFCKRSS